MRLSLKTMLSLSYPYRWKMLFAGFLGAGAIGANIALLGFSALLITKASFMPPILDLMVLIVAVRFFGISRSVLRYGERYVTHDITFGILKKLRCWYYRQMSELSFLARQRLGVGRMFKNIIDDVDVLKFFYLRVLTVPFVLFLVTVGVLIFLGFIHWYLIALLLFLFFVAGFLCPFLFRRVFRSDAAEMQKVRRSYYESLYDYICGLSDLILCGTAKGQQEEIEVYGRRLMRHRCRIGAFESFSQVSTSFFANLALLLSLMLLIPMVEQGAVNGLYLAAVVWVVWASFEALQPVTVGAEYLNESAEAMGEMEKALGEEREAPDGNLPFSAEKEITVSHLSYAYGEHEVLNDMSFSLKPKTKTALVGASGSGKTTLLNILMGFLPYQGSVKNGDTEIFDIKKEILRENIGYLGQDTYLFHSSVRENIRIAKKHATDDEVAAAASAAKIHDFILSLPEGYDTLVGEDGEKLSAGQRQRIALARLFLQDAPMLILDEATQSLDKRTRDDVLTALSQRWQDKTVLYISHDFESLDFMDRILVLEHGRISQSGTHTSLLEEDGYYRNLYRLTKDFFSV